MVSSLGLIVAYRSDVTLRELAGLRSLDSVADVVTIPAQCAPPGNHLVQAIAAKDHRDGSLDAHTSPNRSTQRLPRLRRNRPLLRKKKNAGPPMLLRALWPFPGSPDSRS